MKIKKIISLLLALLLLTPTMFSNAFADESSPSTLDTAVDVFTNADGSTTMTVSKSNNDVLAEYAEIDNPLHLSLPVDGELWFVTGPEDTIIDSSISDGFITYPVTVGGSYTVHPKARLYGANLSLNGTIGVNFYCEFNPSIEYGTDWYAEADGEKIISCTLNNSYDDPLYEFTVNKNADQMSDKINVALYNADGMCMSSIAYSIDTYCDNIAGKDTYTEKAKTLAAAIKDYGKCSSSYVNEETVDTRDIASITEDTLKGLTEHKSDLSFSSGSESTISVAGASLLLGSKTTIKFYFTATEEMGSYTFSCACNDNNVTGISTYGPFVSGEYICYEITELDAQSLDNIYTVTATDASGSTATVSYSAMAYASRKVSSTDNVLSNLCWSLYCYNQAAESYFNS